MKKVIFMLLLVLVGNSAATDWVKVNSNAESTTYVAPQTIRTTGNKAIIWELRSDKIIKYGMGSSKDLVEYDCAKNLSRNITSIIYSQKMGEGTATPYGKAGEWEEIFSGTVGAKYLKIACNN